MLQIFRGKLTRRFLMTFFDFLMLFFGYFINYLILDKLFLFNENKIIQFSQISIYIFISLLIYTFSGQYKLLSAYFSRKDLYKIILRNTIVIGIYYLINNFLFKQSLDLNFLFLIWIFSNIFTCNIRLLIREIYQILKFKKGIKKRYVAIYGAGEAGAALLNYLLLDNPYYKVVAFIDDSPSITGREIGGIKIYNPQDFFKNYKSINTVLLSIPSLTNRRKREIIENLESRNISVLKMPSLKDINEGKAKIYDLKPIDIDDLLNRDAVKSDKSIMSKSIGGFNVCITGAGGSIGSEICKEILKLKPKNLILIERNESSLYKIEKELCNLYSNNIKTYLGSASNKYLVNHIFKENDIDIIFHCAAYKHVNIVQKNPVQGILNNVFSTLNICQNAKKHNSKKVILISTDKAVNPTNVMGASKRLCEIIIQAFSAEQEVMNKVNHKNKIIFSKVRFGNVLGSSGSVVPLFKEQLLKGGPITLTHKDVVRYFMTINEAVQLVIQASALAEGGDLFLLNMGESVKIYDLAKKMIKLGGLTVKDEENPNGDIEIKITGLRPGEKLFEELLVEENSEKTIHPLIFKSRDKTINVEDLFIKLDILKTYLINNQEKESLKILSELVPEWY